MGAKLSVYSLEDSNNNHTLSRVLLQTGTETLFGAEFIINHDADLGVSSVKSADSVFVSNTSVPGQIKLAIANATGITGDKILVEVKFDKIISDSVISVSNVSLNEGGLTSLGAVDTGVFDQDGDGVLDFDEEEIFNTDPDSKDTDGDGCSDRFEIENSADPNNAASFPTRTLTAENTTNGSITSTDTHKLGATTTVTATPNLGYAFTAWTGASSGTNNPLTLTMDGNKTIGATFAKDTADTDGDGFSNYDELVTHKTDPTDANSYPFQILDLNVNILRSGNSIILEWENGELQKSLDLEQGWIDVTDEDGNPVTSPYQIGKNNKRGFFRVNIQRQ